LKGLGVHIDTTN